jgi:hypothetical protein
LSYVIKKGNTTVYEWRTGSVPQKIEKNTSVSVNFGDEEEVIDDKIDFGGVDLNIDLPNILENQTDQVI